MAKSLSSQLNNDNYSSIVQDFSDAKQVSTKEMTLYKISRIAHPEIREEITREIDLANKLDEILEIDYFNREAFYINEKLKKEQKLEPKAPGSTETFDQKCEKLRLEFADLQETQLMLENHYGQKEDRWRVIDGFAEDALRKEVEAQTGKKETANELLRRITAENPNPIQPEIQNESSITKTSDVLRDAGEGNEL